jgi:signal peptidase I
VPSQPSPSASRAKPAPTAQKRKEPWTEQAASFIGFFIYLLILKTFFLPLFIIPTGSMAETLYGAHAIHTCPNCGTEFPLNWPLIRSPSDRDLPASIICPNCRWHEFESRRLAPTKPAVPSDEVVETPPRPCAGDRIFVHGWPHAPPFTSIPGLGPQRWDVTVFKVPTDGETNYIKRLLGLPGEKIELIAGDLFVDDQIKRKPPEAQRALWFEYYDHDTPPRQPSNRHPYHPRWIALEPESGWQNLQTRAPRFDGFGQPGADIQFVTTPGDTRAPGDVNDIYGYNGGHQYKHTVRDVRLSAQVTFEDGDGYLALSIANLEDVFVARLGTDGRLTLEHYLADAYDEGTGTLWGMVQVPTDRPLRLALAIVDYTVSVAVDGETLITTTPEQYDVTPDAARARARRRDNPVVRIRAADAQLTLRHLLIERDVYYVQGELKGIDHRPIGPGYAAQGNPLQLGPNEYFLVGDNSPNSQDARYAFAQPGQNPVGPHLAERYKAGQFQPGTVPGDQLIGRAFFVYWPGFMPLTSRGPNILPDLGRARWIR